jgi:uncharacterized membrane protein (DUF485 family)
MSKNRDLVVILIIIIIGMFIPFLGAIILNYGFDSIRIGITFGHFLLIFSLELAIVYLYFTITNKIAQKKLDSTQQKEK